jgi:hypothetical protein
LRVDLGDEEVGELEVVMMCEWGEEPRNLRVGELE